MLRQFLVGGAVSVCNIAIHALVMALIVQVARSIGTRARQHPSLVRCNELDLIGFDGYPQPRGNCLGFGLLDCRACAFLQQSRLFCLRQLYDTWLWRRYTGRALAIAWSDH